MIVIFITNRISVSSISYVRITYYRWIHIFHDTYIPTYSLDCDMLQHSYNETKVVTCQPFLTRTLGEKP